MKQLLGSELAGFIKERQAKQVRQLVQQHNVHPVLAIITASNNPTIATYINLKKKYGADIGVTVQEYSVTDSDIVSTINSLNKDNSIHGVIVQLPLAEGMDTEAVVSAVSPQKDVDGLAPGSLFDAATPMAINWLLSGYNIELKGKQICIVGYGRLVGAPLQKLWQNSGLDPVVVDVDTKDKEDTIANADIIVTAVGKPSLITSLLVKHGAIVVDAGVASEKGVLKGDVSEDVYTRDDITITPKKGGVGPLTVCALFDNVIRSAYNTVSS
ncbi:bifunctional 5,10-methylenetetrahydrofolate dehydrogenase/5,10-methenyltetrahydrofolate cyclohydrolase [Candidatus Saccharibacteria bacterium]|nr:bifunctional 5,10-methylenetetrahydrofolate dehydrogenase/5,10-methenyltetrahydrofolate cyclohydrolase [Candidatus Saccharibacteria bacterium]